VTNAADEMGDRIVAFLDARVEQSIRTLTRRMILIFGLWSVSVGALATWLLLLR
jgi:hypothetical protein